MKRLYTEFINEYENLGHMTDITEELLNEHKFINYLPHHAVLRESSSTTKLRVVFDGSCKTASGVSLNDTLHTGPALQPELFSIILRFRLHKYVLSADIAKFYRKILIQPDQRNLQVILWRENQTEPIVFRLNTVTYGLGCAPFLAIKYLHEVSREFDEIHSKTAEIIRTDIYVDDLLTRSDCHQELSDRKIEITKILQSAGLELCKWMSNEPRVFDSTNSSSTTLLHVGEEFKTLGVFWNPTNDILLYKIGEFDLSLKTTKRHILSTISQIYDPLGLVGPIIIKIKILLQKIWQLKLSWDESVRVDIHTSWIRYLEQLPCIDDLKIPRHIVLHNYCRLELHGFCDASEAAYGECIYAKSINERGQCKIVLLCAKSRVAPLKSLSLPRLELCGALLLAQLHSKVVAIISREIHANYLWSDSQNVLAWINGEPNQWKTFIYNRVAEIHTLTKMECWRYVSRGISPIELNSLDLWWSGPKWPYEEESH